MKRSRNVSAALAAAVLLLGASPAAADECSSRVSRATVAPCALSASLAVAVEGHELEAAEGRRLAASPLLPSNPVVTLSAGRRSSAGGDATNWYASLAQELEIAGQRGLRREAGQAEVDAQEKRVRLSKREVAAQAWTAYFEALAARDEQRLVTRLVATTLAVSSVAQARATQGLIAPVDADVADAAYVHVLQAKLAADRKLAEALAHLSSLLGLDPTEPIVLEGDLIPLAGLDGAATSAGRATAARPELLALEAEQRALELRADAFRRTRVPNPTLSVYAQNDGFNERVLGLGLSFPIPLPGNVGRTHVGEIAEAEALSRRVGAERRRAQRAIRLEVVTAAQVFDSRTEEVAAFTPERLGRASTSLRSLGEEVESGRLAVRDAIVAQNALIELLQADVAARRAWCLASVELARAAGLPLEKGAP